MTTPIEGSGHALDWYFDGEQTTDDLARTAFESIDRDELARVIDDRWLTNPMFVADAILEWLLS
jgi:hypothetical protein